VRQKTSPNRTVCDFFTLGATFVGSQNIPIKKKFMKVNKKLKDSLFSFLFSNQDILRELYSAIEGIPIPPDIPIDINTLSGIIYKDKINDLSFT